MTSANHRSSIAMLIHTHEAPPISKITFFIVRIKTYAVKKVSRSLKHDLPTPLINILSGLIVSNLSSLEDSFSN